MQSLITKIHKRYPTYDEPNVKWMYIITILQNSWFQVGNWLLYALLFVNTGTFAVYEAIAFAMGILFEIPSGAFADLFGRRKTVIVGAFLQAFGSILFTLGFLHDGLLFIGNMLIIVSFAFRSGAEEALIYDSLEQKNKSQYYDDIRGKNRSLVSLAIVITSLIGGLAWKVSVYLPWTLTSIVFFLGFLATFKYREPSTKPHAPKVGDFLAQNKKGFYFLFKSDLKKYTLSLAIITGSFLMWHSGIIRALMGRDFGYNGQTINYLIATTSLVGFLVAYKFRSIRHKLGDRFGFLLLLFMSGLAWLATGLLPGSLALGFVVFLTITSSGILAEIWTSVILNKHIQSRYRATVISTLSFLIQIPYVLIAILFGQLIEKGEAAQFYITVGLLLFVGLGLYYRAEKSKLSVATSENS